MRAIIKILLTVMLMSSITVHTWAQTPQIEWLREFGTSASEDAESIAVDGVGNVYVTGHTQGDFAVPNVGSSDAFLAKYDPSGNPLWTRQLGTTKVDSARSVAVDALGNAYIAGKTTGDLGGTHFGESDAFLAKYNAAGALQWTRQVGTTGDDIANSLDIDANGNIYLSGDTNGNLGGANAGNLDMFIAKYDPAGSLLWTQQIGDMDNNLNSGVAVDEAGNMFISGSSLSPLVDSHSGNWDISLAKYDTTGILQWSRRLFTPVGDNSSSIAVDTLGNAYVSGAISTVPPQTPNFGKHDTLLIKIDQAGNTLWTRQLGTELQNDFSHSVAVDKLGNAFITGLTDGRYEDDIFGEERFGSADAFVIKYDVEGNHLWTKQLGTSDYDSSNSIALDAFGSIYIAGGTSGSFGAPNPGGMYFAKLIEIPEPSSWLLLLCGIATATQRRRKMQP